MKWKRKTDETTCDAAGCKAEEGLVGYGPGVVRTEPAKLCDRHRAALDAEKPFNRIKAGLEDAIAYVGGDTSRGTAHEPAFDTAALVAEAAEAKDVLALVKEYRIVTQEDMDFADQCLGEVKDKLRTYKAKKEEATKPMNTALKAVRAWFAPVEDFYGEAEKIWKAKIGAWKSAENERQRLALEAVQEAHKAGDVQAVANAMAVAAQATVSVPSNITVREVWNFAVENPDLVPREYCSPDDKKLRQAVEARGKEAAIPGVKVWPGTAVTRHRS